MEIINGCSSISQISVLEFSILAEQIRGKKAQALSQLPGGQLSLIE
jgi:hypothetical protein